MTAILALAKTLTDGRTAAVMVEPSGLGECPPVTTAIASDGTALGEHVGPPHRIPRSANAPSSLVAAIGRLLLTRPEADQVTQVYEQVRAEVARTPDLHRERVRLVEAVAAAQEQWLTDRADAVDDPDGRSNPFAADSANERLIDRHTAALAAFDRDHPEIAAAAAAARAAQVSRVLDHGL